MWKNVITTDMMLSFVLSQTLREIQAMCFCDLRSTLVLDDDGFTQHLTFN